MDEPSTSEDPLRQTTGAAAPCSFDLIDATGHLSSSEYRQLSVYLRRALDHLGLVGEVRIRVVGDAEMARAHEQFLGVAGSTDVITFNLGDGTDEHGPPRLDVDLLLCLDEASRQSSALGTGRWRELLLYAVHGVLHCAGYDDTDEASAARMHRAEDDVLEKIGVGRVFEAGGDAGAPHHAGAAAGPSEKAR